LVCGRWLELVGLQTNWTTKSNRRTLNVVSTSPLPAGPPPTAGLADRAAGRLAIPGPAAPDPGIMPGIIPGIDAMPEAGPLSPVFAPPSGAIPPAPGIIPPAPDAVPTVDFVARAASAWSTAYGSISVSS
jgi:hypothetical protein